METQQHQVYHGQSPLRDNQKPLKEDQQEILEALRPENRLPIWGQRLQGEPAINCRFL